MPTCYICGKTIRGRYAHDEAGAICIGCVRAMAHGDVPGGPEREETIRWAKEQLRRIRRI
ncbi:MAG: hypothetical protein JRD89_04440 [Deltaproteobacteria bacterium]|nr:hypothetical protein [Deltaproteobacteria bacterium]